MTGPSDPVSTFLHNVVPWASGTFVNIEAYEWLPDKNGSGGKLSPQKASRAARDLNEATGFAKWCDSMGWEVYLRMSSQRNPGVSKKDKRGRVNYRALSGALNAAAMRAFWVDVDVKPGAYATTEDALQGLVMFCAATGLPAPSFVVYSGGGGFHLHWVLDRVLMPAEWLPAARSLAEACRQHGLHADHNLTVNPVCLLRLAGTHNRKYGAPRDVLLVTTGTQVSADGFISLLGSYPSGLGASPGNPGVNFNLNMRNDVVFPPDFPSEPAVELHPRWTEGISPPPLTLELEEVAKGCPLVKATLENGGAGQREPLWFAMGHVAVFTAGGVKDYHKLSAGHASYVPADTDAKFARALLTKHTGDYGWPSCQSMVNAGSTRCASCPNLAQGKSPLNFAVRTTVPFVPVTPQGNANDGDNRPKNLKILPVPGYLDDPVEGTFSHPATDKQPQTLVWSYAMWNLEFREDTMGRFGLHFVTQRSRKTWVTVMVPTSAMRNTDTLRACLVDRYGLGVMSTEQKGLLDFMASFKSQLRVSVDTVARQELMGWVEENGEIAAFIYGPFRFSPKGTTAFNQTDPIIRDMYFPAGSPEPWNTAIRMSNAEKRPEMDILVATTFAAPLMKFTGEKGVVLSAYSAASARHKTTAIKIGQAVWGSFLGINQLTDTGNSVIERIGLLRVMPSYFDEMKSSMDVKKFAEMVYQFAGGRGKGRLNRNAELKNIQEWETLLVGVSNDSLVDAISQHDKTTEAGVNRVFEFEVGPPSQAGQINMGDAGVALKKLETNYGHAGLIYAEYIGTNIPMLRAAVPAMVNDLTARLNAPHDERFWVSAAAVLLVGAQIANNLGLTKFDIPAMADFITKTFQTMRTVRSRTGINVSVGDNIYNILSAFVNHDRRAILATDTVGLAGRAGASQSVLIFNIEDVRYSTQLNIRYIEDTRVLRISRRALNTWLVKQDLPPGVMINQIIEHYKAKEIRSSIGTGTDRKGAVEKLIELDLNHPDLGGLVSKYRK